MEVSTFGILGRTIMISIFLVVLGLVKARMPLVESSHDNCVLSFVIPKDKIKSTCTNTANIVKRVTRMHDDLMQQGKDLKDLRVKSMEDHEVNYSDREELRKRIVKLEAIINHLIGYRTSRPTEDMSRERPAPESPSYSQYYGKGHQPTPHHPRSPRMRVEVPAEVPQLQVMVAEHMGNALKNVNNTISNEVTKQLKEYAANFNEALRRNLQPEANRIHVIDEGVRAEQPVSTRKYSNTVNYGSEEITLQLKSMKKNIKELTRSYEELRFEQSDINFGMNIKKLEEQFASSEARKLKLQEKLTSLVLIMNETNSKVAYMMKQIQEFDEWKRELNNVVRQANISAIKVSHQLNSSLYEYIDTVLLPLDTKVQEIADESDMLEELITTLKQVLNTTHEKHADSIGVVEKKIQSIDDGMKLQFSNISQILYTAIEYLKGTDNTTAEKLQKYNKSIAIMKGNLLGKIQHVNFTMQLLKTHTMNQSEEMKKQAIIIKHLNTILNSTSLKMNSMKKELLQFRTEVLLNSGAWAPYNFTWNTHISTMCMGRRYIKKTKYRVGKYVGVILCHPGRYKILLSNNMYTDYMDIADSTGVGEDHCEFVGASRSGKYLLGKRSISRVEGFGRDNWGEEPRRQKIEFMSPTSYWYQCGVNIP